MKIILLGPPGSGKGLFAQFLQDDFGIKKIATGDILRKEIRNKSKIGKKAEKYVSKGIYVPDKIVLSMIKNKIRRIKNFTLDGFPRTVKQAKFLDKVIKVDKVIHITTNDKNVIKRIANRLQCGKCNRIYNLITIKPRRKGICDICKGKLYIRSDDKIVKTRLNVYKREIKPLIIYYKKKDVLEKVNGNRHFNLVYNDIRKLIK